MPESITCTRSCAPLPATSCTSARSMMRPESVNLTALLTRLLRIWRIRCASPMQSWPLAASTAKNRRTPLRSASGAYSNATLSIRGRTAKGAGSTSSCPASILEKSSTSLMIRISASAEKRMRSNRSRWPGCRGERASSSRWPSTPLSGVRISWLIVATNADLARVAASAAWRADSASSRARRSVSSSSTCAVTSRSAQTQTAWSW